MNGNWKLANRLSEAYALGEIGRSYGGSYNNQYLNTAYDNYPCDRNELVNNIGRSEMLARYSGNPISIEQQRCFGEIANEIIDQSDLLTATSNQNILGLSNEMSNTFSNNNRVQSQQMQTLQPRRSQKPKLAPRLNNYVAAGSIKDTQSVNDDYGEFNNYDDRESFQVNNSYRQERDYRQRYLNPEDNRRQLTLIVIYLLVGAFILFMMMQIYSNQKKLEYIVGIYACNPVNSPYYRIYANDNEM